MKDAYEKQLIRFGTSRASCSITIRKVSYAITTYLGPDFIKFPLTEESVKEKVHFYDANKIPQCLGAIDGTHLWRKSTFRHKNTKMSYLYYVVALTLLYLLVLVALQSVLLFPSYKGKRVDH